MHINIVKHIAAQIVNALDYCKTYNICHRDLKPENIMLDDNFDIKIVRFIINFYSYFIIIYFHIKIDFSTGKIIGNPFDKKLMKFENEKIIYDINDINFNNIDLNSLNCTESIFISNDNEKDKNHDDNNLENKENKEDEEDEDNSEKEKRRRPTFCGTAEYVSPEMLFGEDVEYEADYWALGCIIYKLITGSSPFKEKSQFLVFQNIKTLNIKWTDKIDIVSKDLIKKLLKHKPKERLGSFSISEIINHEFFLDDEKKNIIENMKPNSIPFRNSLRTKGDMIEQEIKLVILKEKENKKIFKIKEQLVEKKSPYFHYNTRILRLDDTPKLEYLDPETKEVKGTIYLTVDCEAKVQNLEKFELVTPKRSFLFKVPDDDAGVWGKLINDEITKLKENPQLKNQSEELIKKEIEFKNSQKKKDNPKIY